jgi:hypothetical protein
MIAKKTIHFIAQDAMKDGMTMNVTHTKGNRIA